MASHSRFPSIPLNLLALTFLAIALSYAETIAPFTLPDPLILPIEVIGPVGTTQQVTIDLGPQGATANNLWLRVNNLSYDHKASVKINDSPWVHLNNEDARKGNPIEGGLEIPEPDYSYGGIGGGFHTIRIIVHSDHFTTGKNTLQFRFSRSDGISSGYRIIDYNIRKDEQNLIPDGLFIHEDPQTWRPPHSDPKAIAAGEQLWKYADLTEPDGTRLQSKCADCHLRSGLDLKYFGYSNHSIIERSKFHGLSQTEGEQIASYIRTLPFDPPPNGRPWNPPYQPGPGSDARGGFDWLSGMGLDTVLEKDEDMLPYLFGSGSQADIDQAADVDGKLNLRDMPIAVQFPDWNRWLPRVGPHDIWKRETFEAGAAHQGFQKLHQAFQNGGARKLAKKGKLFETYNQFGWDLMRNWLEFVNGQHPWVGYDGAIGRRDGPIQMTKHRAKYDFTLWHSVKHVELMMEHELWDLAKIEEPQLAEDLQYPFILYINFALAGHFGQNDHDRNDSSWPWEEFHFPHEKPGPYPQHPAFGLPGHLGAYMSSIWYQVQMTMAPGNHRGQTVEPVDWAYNIQHVNLTALRTGVMEPLRLYQNIIKCLQQRNRDDHGIRHDTWTMREVSPWRYWADFDGRTYNTAFANTYQEDLWPRIMTGLLKSFLKRSKQFEPSDWPRSPEVKGAESWYKIEPNDHQVDPSSSINGYLFAHAGSAATNEADAIAKIIPPMLEAGVDTKVIGDLAQWAKSLWPRYNWEQYISPQK